MAVTDRYAEAADYRNRVGKQSTDDDDVINDQLTAISRYLDQRLGRFFTKDAEPVARYYSGSGGTILELDDDIAVAFGLVVKVDEDEDGSFADENALEVNTDFWLGPYNADKGPEPQPYEFLELNPNSTRLSYWPAAPRNIEVTASFGWPAVPGAIKEATIAICRQLRDTHEAGGDATVELVEQTVGRSPHLTALMLDLERMYKKERL